MNRSAQIQPFLAQQEERNITRNAILRTTFAFAILLIFLEGESNRSSKKQNNATVLVSNKSNLIKPSKSYPPMNVSGIMSLLYPNHDIPIQHKFNSSGTFVGDWNSPLQPSPIRLQLDINSREVFDSIKGFDYIYGTMKVLDTATITFNPEIQHLAIQQNVLPIQGM